MSKPQTIIVIHRIDHHDNAETVSKQETGMNMRAVELLESFTGLLVALGWAEKAVHDAVFELAESIDPEHGVQPESEPQADPELPRPFWRLLNEGETIEVRDQVIEISDDGDHEGWSPLDPTDPIVGHRYTDGMRPIRRWVR